MAYELKEGQWNLHKQDPDKKKKENSPDFFGSLKIGGIEYQLSGWGKMSNEGKPYISGMCSLRQDAPKATQDQVDQFMVTDRMEQALAPPPPATEPEQPNDDLPF